MVFFSPLTNLRHRETRGNFSRVNGTGLYVSPSPIISAPWVQIFINTTSIITTYKRLWRHRGWRRRRQSTATTDLFCPSSSTSCRRRRHPRAVYTLATNLPRERTRETRFGRGTRCMVSIFRRTIYTYIRACFHVLYDNTLHTQTRIGGRKLIIAVSPYISLPSPPPRRGFHVKPATTILPLDRNNIYVRTLSIRTYVYACEYYRFVRTIRARTGVPGTHIVYVVEVVFVSTEFQSYTAQSCKFRRWCLLAGKRLRPNSGLLQR